MGLKAFFQDIGHGIKEMFKGPEDPNNVYNLNGRTPLRRALPFGLQHVFTMFAANVTPFLIVFAALGMTQTIEAKQAMMAALFVAGLGTLMQLLFGSRMPMVIGTSFTFVPIFIVIGNTVMTNGGSAVDAYYTILCASVVGGLVVALWSFFYKYWGRLIKPIVPGIVVLAIGLSLLSAGATDFLGGSGVLSYMASNGGATEIAPYWLYVLVAVISLAAAIGWNLLIPGVYKNLNIMFGILFGYAVSCFISIAYPGFVDFSGLTSISGVGPNGWIGTPTFVPLSTLFAHFDWVPTIMTTLCFLASTVESIGDSSSIAEMGLGRKVTTREVTGTLVCDGFNSAFGACFGSFPLTTYSQNVGLVAQTKTVNRYTIFIGSLFLILASFFPPIASFIYTIPGCVIGGCMVILFGSIAVIGMKMCGEAGWSDKNILILSVTLCLGFGISISSAFIEAMNAVNPYLGGVFQNNVIMMFLVGFILSWVLPDSMEIKIFHKKKNDGEAK
jgi:uracil-xanthine permease